MSLPQPSSRPRLEELEESARRILVALGEDPHREGLQATPRRVARSLLEMTDGYGVDIHVLARGALYAHEGHEPVTIRDIPFYSLCEHHLLPMFGRCHIGYVHLDELELYPVFGEGVLERVPARTVWTSEPEA